MKTIITQTPRLYLREFVPEDGVHFYAMNSDPEVIRYTGDKAFNSAEEAIAFIGDYKDYEHHGVGRWAVVRKRDGLFLGWCGLKFHPQQGLTDVGFRFYKKYWDRGYATEAARAVVAYGFDTLSLVRIHAHAHRENLASVGVLKKLGMKAEAEITYHGMPALLFSINNPAYHITPVSGKEAMVVRHPILRQGRPYESAAFEGDYDPVNFHLGMYYKSELIGVVSMMKKPDPSTGNTGFYQLRGMAVLPQFRKVGVGRVLVEEAEMEARRRGNTGIWLNAREKAASFYRKLGYEQEGDAFNIEGIGLHYRMRKAELSNT